MMPPLEPDVHHALHVRYQRHAARPQAPLAEAPFHSWASPDNTVWMQFYREHSDYLLRFPDQADFRVASDGLSVSGWPVPGVSDGTMEHLYLNQVLPLALSRAGQLMLHGSAVEVAGNGVAFIGPSGRGKSTLAASFATSGSRFLTDDGLQLRWLDEQCWVSPSHPSVRLWEDSEAALISHAVDKAPSVEYTTKARLLAGEHIAFCRDLRRLRRVYFLGEGVTEAPTIRALPAVTALLELAKNTFLLDIHEAQTLRWHFDEMARLAALPIHFCLDFPRRYDRLPEVRAAIIRHVTENQID